MGNQYWFKLSGMMPNAWFYKLRHITRPNRAPQKLPPPPPPALKPPGKPCYHLPESQFFHNPISPQNPKFQDARFPHEPRRTSLKRRARRKTIYMPSPRQKPPNFDSEGSFQPTDDAFSDSFLDRSTFPDSDSSGPGTNLDAFVGVFPAHPCKISEPDLSPITRRNSEPTGPKRNAGPARKSFSRIGGVKVKVKLCGNAPKTGSKRTENKRRRSKVPPDKKLAPFYAESLAIVKASIDPERDFRESMVEMIVENNIRASKDLEDLLACYLSLNSHQYHGLIIRAFEQIWFSLMSLTHC